MIVESNIRKLLYDHDCVIVPDFGAFILEYESATIHPVKNTFSPPRKKIAFNESLKKNDGLLVNEIAINEDNSKEEALSLIWDFTKRLKVEIGEYEYFRIDGLGTFKYNTEGNIEFTPDERINYLDESFGLPEFYFKPIDRLEEEEEMKRAQPTHPRQAIRRAPVRKGAVNPSGINSSESVESNAVGPVSKDSGVEKQKLESTVVNVIDQPTSSNVSDNNTPEKGRKKVAFLIIPLVLILLVGAGGGYLFLNNKKQTTDHASLIVSNDDENVEEVIEVENEDVVSESISETNNQIESEVIESVSEVNTEAEVEVTNSPSVISKSGSYHMIVGSFDTESNATKLISELGNGEILNSNGRFRVSVASYPSEGAAVSDIESIKTKYNTEVWVLKY